MDASSPTPNITPGKQQPEKYIRTFAGDMDMVKKGGTPDLAPLGGAPSLPKPVIATPTTAPTPTPAPIPQPTPASSPVPATFVPTASVPSPAAIVSPQTVTTPPPVVPAVSPKNPPLQTYSNDFRDRMKSTRASTATVLAAEQDRAQRTPQVPPQEPSHIGLPYIIAGLVLLVISISGGAVAYLHYKNVSAPIVSVPTVSAPIFVDERQEVAGTGEALLQAITDSVSRPLASGTVRLVYVASTTGTENIFPTLPVSAPNVLLRNINTIGNMAGVINVGGNQSPFFILSVSSYSNVFSGMLSWESLMPEYLAGLFPPYPALVPRVTTEIAPVVNASSTPVSSTTPKNTSKVTTLLPKVTKVASSTPAAPAFVAGFYDAVIANHDVRVYRDASGRDVLLYGFWNQMTLIIARDAVAFTEIVTRLGTASTQQ